MLCYKEGCRETIATRILIFYWLMGLSSMNLLIRLTEGTYTVFNRFDKPEGHPLLLSSGMTTRLGSFRRSSPCFGLYLLSKVLS